MKKLILPALTLLFLTLSGRIAAAQTTGMFIDKGIGAGLGVSSNDNATQIMLEGSYAFNPMVEAGIGLARAEYDGENMAATGFGPFLGLYPLRQNEETPVSIRVGLGYTYQTLSGDAIDQLEDLGLDVDVTGNTILLNGAVFHRLAAGPSLDIIPVAEVGYVRQQTSIRASGFGNSGSDSDSESNTYFSIGGVFAFPASPTSIIAVTPAITFSNGESSLSLRLSMAFPQ